MNNERRKKIKEVIGLINQSENVLQDVLNEEDDAFNNLSEGLQCTMRGEAMENNISELEEAIGKLKDALENLDNID